MATILRLVLLCLVVGLLLAFFNITPHGILTDTARTIREVWELIGSFMRWALPYIMLGAVIVVPLALISFLLRRGRRSS